MTSIAGLKRKYGGQMVAKKAKEVVRRNRAPRIKGAIKPSKLPELKYVDIAQAAYAVDTTGSITALNLIAVGDDNTTRDGRQVNMKSVQLHGILVPSDDITEPFKGRVMLIWDNAANGALPAVTDVLTAATGTAFPLVNNQNRFTILVDRTYSVGKVNAVATLAFATCPSVFDVEIYKKLNAVTQYSGTTAAIGSVQNGALLLLTIGTQANGTGGTLLASIRSRFIDE